VAIGGLNAGLHSIRLDLTRSVAKQRLEELSRNDQMLARGESGCFVDASGR
jgi:hypothetical protein